MLDPRHDFDRQAQSFDRRAGLPPDACNSIARQIVRIASLTADDLVLEIGAGTGQIGATLLEHPVRYLGFDLSVPMLREFARRSTDIKREPWLVAADANAHWPVRDRTVCAIFGSRSLHLLQPNHVVDEIFRVSVAKGALLLIGRVKREQHSVRARLQRQMHAILASRGYRLREGRQADERLLAACIERGASALPPIEAAAWHVDRSAADVLQSWRAKSLLGGIEVAGDVKKAILDDLASWAATEFGSLDTPHASTERYLINGVQLPNLSR